MKNSVKILVLILFIFLVHSCKKEKVPIPSNGLVAYYPFNGSANDESVNGNNGTVYGATLTNDRFGNPNSAYSFNGIDNEILIFHNSSLNCFPISVSAWFKTNTNLQNSMLVNKYGCMTYNGYSLNLNSGKPNCYYFSGNADSETNRINLDMVSDSFQSLNDNNWHQSIITIDLSGVKYYVDGNLVYSGSFTGTGSVTTTTENLHLGRYVQGNCGIGQNFFYLGYLDDIGIWNRVLSQQEITNLYQN